MRYRLLLLSVVATLTTMISCYNEENFSCSLVSTEVENIDASSATLLAKIDATDYGTIEQMGFFVAVAGSDNFDIYPVERARIIELKLNDLQPNTAYDYECFVRAENREWRFGINTFKTLAEQQPNPNPNPDPDPDPDPEPDPEPEPTPGEAKTIAEIEALDPKYSRFPICVAKTQYSFSDDPAKLGAPVDFDVTIKNVKVSAGAGFIVAFAGDIIAMPGLPRVPAAEGIDVNPEGKIVGLF